MPRSALELDCLHPFPPYDIVVETGSKARSSFTHLTFTKQAVIMNKHFIISVSSKVGKRVFPISDTSSFNPVIIY